MKLKAILRAVLDHMDSVGADLNGTSEAALEARRREKCCQHCPVNGRGHHG